MENDIISSIIERNDTKIKSIFILYSEFKYKIS
jgi:hypothetical protein